jgi:hypothetical protein
MRKSLNELADVFKIEKRNNTRNPTLTIENRYVRHVGRRVVAITPKILQFLTLLCLKSLHYTIHERFASKDFDDTPEMNEKEPSRKERSCLVDRGTDSEAGLPGARRGAT